MAFPRGLGAFGRKVIRHGWLVVVIAVVASLASVSVMKVRALSAPSGPVVSPKGAPKLPSFAPAMWSTWCSVNPRAQGRSLT